MSQRSTAARRSQRPPTSRFATATSRLVEDFRRRRPLRAGSLLVSVFGDSIAPRGGRVWLGSLIRVLEHFGVNQRLVRTSVFRLARDGWLASESVGRRSDYFLTDEGAERIRDASRRIYAAPYRDWDGAWTLVLLSQLPGPERERLRQELGWLGFAPFSSNLLAHPHADEEALEHLLDDMDSAQRPLTLSARAGSEQAEELNNLVHGAWALDQLGARYAEFVERFAPVLAGARRVRKLAPELAFQARTLLIHEYRKIVLRDPLLPDELLPADWEGIEAFRLCRDLYGIVEQAAEAYIDDAMETAGGNLPRPRARLAHRFDDID